MINASHVNAIRRLVIDVTQVLKSEYVKFSASCTAVREPRSFFLFSSLGFAGFRVLSFGAFFLPFFSTVDICADVEAKLRARCRYFQYFLSSEDNIYLKIGSRRLDNRRMEDNSAWLFPEIYRTSRFFFLGLKFSGSLFAIYINPSHPNISIHTLHIVLYTRRICVTIKNSIGW